MSVKNSRGDPNSEIQKKNHYMSIFRQFSQIFFFLYFKLLFTIRSSNSLDPDQARHQNIGPDLGPNCLQRFSADDKSLLPWKVNIPT